MGDMTIRCPMCGAWLTGNPYKTIAPYSEHAGKELSSDGPTPEWFIKLPISGQTFDCQCGCSVRVPVRHEPPEWSVHDELSFPRGAA